MTNAQLRDLLKWSIRYIASENTNRRMRFINRITGRIEPRTMALQVAKTDMFLSRARKAVAKPKAARKPK